ncbi:hypothetical protein V2J09_006692 [Rumex salicifolius]
MLFNRSGDGSASYEGGEANAVNINNDTYFLPGNSRSLIKLGSNKDLIRMLRFHENSVTADIYILGKEGFDNSSVKVNVGRVSGVKVAETVDHGTACDALSADTSDSSYSKSTSSFEPSDDSSESYTPKSTKYKRYIPESSAVSTKTTDLDGKSVADNCASVRMVSTPADTVKKRRRAAVCKAFGSDSAIDADEIGKRESVTRKKRPRRNAADMVNEMAPLPSESDPEDSDAPSNLDNVAPGQVVASWKKAISSVGQEFRNVDEFREALRRYAVAHQFTYKLKKSDATRVSCKCAAEDCPWRIYASKVQAGKAFRIKKMVKSHTCGGESRKSAQPTRRWLVKMYLVRRAIEDVKVEMMGSQAEAYDDLPKFCKKGPFTGERRGFLAQSLTNAAHATRLDVFEKYMEEIKQISPSSHEWLQQTGPEHWASAMFVGEQYNQITENPLELLDKLLEEEKAFPITHKIVAMVSMMSELITDRQMESSGWTTKLTPSKENILRNRIMKAQKLRVLFSNELLFEVRDDYTNAVNGFNITTMECSCCVWRVTGIPCCHGIAVFNCTDRDAYDYCSPFFSVDRYIMTYSMSITPLLENDNIDSSEHMEALEGNEHLALTAAGYELSSENVVGSEHLSENVNGYDHSSKNIGGHEHLSEFLEDPLEILEVNDHPSEFMENNNIVQGNKHLSGTMEGNERPSDEMEGNERPSDEMEGNELPSEHVEGNHSDNVEGNQFPSVIMEGNERPSDNAEGNVLPSGIVEVNHRLFEIVAGIEDPSENVEGKDRSSEVLEGKEHSSENMEGKGPSPGIMKGNKRSSKEVEVLPPSSCRRSEQDKLKQIKPLDPNN